MDELVAFLKSYGLPTWIIVAIVVLAILVRPLVALIQRVRKAPSLDDIIAQRMAALGAHTDALIRGYRREVADAKAVATKAHKALRDCEEKHEALNAKYEALLAEVTALKRSLAAETP